MEGDLTRPADLARAMARVETLKLGEASKVAPVDKLSVVLVALFAVVFLGERPTSREWMGIALVGGGVLRLSLRRQPPGGERARQACRLATETA